MQTTLHTCTNENGNWHGCDRGGFSTSSYENDKYLMCPSDKCIINSNKVFRVSHSQNEDYINVWFEQDGRSTSFNVDNHEKIGKMAEQGFDGMVFVAQIWGMLSIYCSIHKTHTHHHRYDLQ